MNLHVIVKEFCILVRTD